MDGLFRRGGMWWTRLVVPARLRQAAGRREFTKSTGVHDKTIAKVVALVLLADWRRQLLRLDNYPMDDTRLLKLIDGAPALAAGDHVALGTASDALGLEVVDLVREASTGRLSLWFQVGAAAGTGYIVAADVLELVDPEVGPSGGRVVPNNQPGEAQAAVVLGAILRLSDSAEVAGAILGDGLSAVDLVALEAPGRQGWLYCPNEAARVAVCDLLVLRVELEALRARAAATVAPERVQAARATRSPPVGGKDGSVGIWAEKPFSEALTAYCTRSDGLAQALASEHERRQRMAGMMLLVEFLGDMALGEMDADTLRQFRERMREIPDHANRLKGAERGATMTETISILQATRPDYRRMTDAQVGERMQWLARLFAWLRKNGYIHADPALVLRGESGLTKAERIASERDDDTEPGRRPFTEGELLALFAQPHYQTGNGAHVIRRNERWRPFEYWAPLIALFAGLRLGEVAQLYLDDVMEIDGQWCFDVNRRSPDKSLKTSASVRRVPLHGKLIELGFVAYCQRLQARGFRRAFPELRYASGPARYGKELGRVMTKVLRGLGLPADVTFHSLRHCCNGALQRAAGDWSDPMLRTFIRYKVIGHELPEDVNFKHYTSTTVAEMARLVNGAVFELPEIAPFDLEHAVMRLGQYLPGGAADEDMGPAA
nr:site-specific integrase [uncultured Rhodoferax sp.]